MRAAVTLVCRPFLPTSSTGGQHLSPPSVAFGLGARELRAWVPPCLTHAVSLISTRRPWGRWSPRWRPPWQPGPPAPHPERRLRFHSWNQNRPVGKGWIKVTAARGGAQGAIKQGDRGMSSPLACLPCVPS